ncbi:MAG: hypothetical protein AB1429_12330 [Pseudomonadota bacterium]|jgi:hypothetical protein
MGLAETFAVAAVSALALWSVRVWALAYSDGAKIAVSELDKAAAAGQRLLDDPETPASIVRFVPAFMAGAGRPGLARGFTWRLLTGRMAKAPSREDAQRFRAELDQLRPSQKDAFAEFVAAVMMSSAVVDPFLSRPVLDAVATFLSTSGRKDGPQSVERTETLAVDFAVRSARLHAA